MGGLGGGFGLVVALLAVLGLGSGVMVFKQSVDDERQRVAQLSRELSQARARSAQLRAELAYHQRPDYLAPHALRLGLVAGEPVQLTNVADLPERPTLSDDAAGPLLLVALPSGQRITVMRRPMEGSAP